MRNYLTLVLSLMIVTSPAFASRARLESLGEGKDGSLYINDINNVFYNPAFINDYKKKLMLEFGNAGNTTADSSGYTAGAVTSTGRASSKPQGLFTNTMGDFAYGVSLGHMDDRVIGVINSFNASAGQNFITPDNNLGIMFGGDAGVKWGVGVNYASNYNQPAAPGIKQTTNLMGINLGVEAGNLQAFGTAVVIGSSKGSTVDEDEIKGINAFDLGAAYKMDDMWTVFGKFTTAAAEYDANAVKTTSTNAMTLDLGVGYKKDVTKSVNLYSKLDLNFTQTKIKDEVTPAESSVKSYNVPLTLGAEAQALSWLAVRASIAQSLLGQNFTGTSAHAAMTNTTTIASGVGMTFGDLTVDGMVANNGGTSQNFGFGDNMLSRISATYNF